MAASTWVVYDAAAMMTASVATGWSSCGSFNGSYPTTKEDGDTFELDAPVVRRELFSQIVGTILILTPIALIAWWFFNPS